MKKKKKTARKATKTKKSPVREPAPTKSPLVTATHPDRLLSSHEAGKYIQVNPSSINKWVKEGRIKAFRTPGGHRRIKVGDFTAFLTEHDMPIPEALSAGVMIPRAKRAA